MSWKVWKIERRRRPAVFLALSAETPAPVGSKLVAERETEFLADDLARRLAAQREREFRLAEGTTPEDSW